MLLSNRHRSNVALFGFLSKINSLPLKRCANPNFMGCLWDQGIRVALESGHLQV